MHVKIFYIQKTFHSVVFILPHIYIVDGYTNHQCRKWILKDLIWRVVNCAIALRGRHIFFFSTIFAMPLIYIYANAIRQWEWRIFPSLEKILMIKKKKKKKQECRWNVEKLMWDEQIKVQSRYLQKVNYCILYQRYMYA